MTRVPLCTVPGCPAPSDPDWHVPICGHGTAIEHHHVIKRSQGGKGGLVVPLCPRCHDEIDNGLWSNAVRDFHDGTVRYFILDLHGETVLERIMERKEEEAITTSSEGDLQFVEAIPDDKVPMFVSPRVSFPPEPATSAPGIDERRPALPEPQWTPTSLVLPRGLDRSRWLSIMQLIGQMPRSWHWWGIDGLIYGEGEYGEEYAQALDELGKSYKTVANVLSVGRAFPPSRRRESLKFSHHAAIAALDETDQDKWLDRAETENLSVHELRRLVNDEDPECPESETGRHDWAQKCRVCGEER